ncbi:unnamed protein product [Arabis nemorensis]|uniref:ARID domain-containing protein n=1 Tax=Arabis nemorensis TaxID=586526 RepID=A0A565CLM5_9BRAS|nr:unnamed protein product [Arabis nemorensis]
MESAMENITEMESERVEQGIDKEIETEEQSQDNVKETENTNPGETVGEEAIVEEHKDSHCPMVIEESSSLDSSKVTPILEKGTNDDDPLKIDDEKAQDEKNSQLEASSHLGPSPSVTLDPEEGLVEPTVEEHNIGSSEVNSDILKNDGDSVMVDNDNAVVHGEKTTIPDTKLSDEEGSPQRHANTMMELDKAAEEHEMMSSGDRNEFPVSPDTKLSENRGSLHHHANTVMEQDKAAEEHEMMSSGDRNEFSVSSDTKLSENRGSPHHHANTVMEQDKAPEEHEMIPSGDRNEVPVSPDTKLSEDIGSPHRRADTVMEPEKSAEEHEMLSSGDHNEFPVSPDTKVVKENNDRIDEDEANNMNLADHGSGPVDHDQGTVTELHKEAEVPESETISKLDNKPSESLIETSMNEEKEPDVPATENLTDNDENSDVLATGVSGDTEKELSLLPATQTLSDHNEGMTTLEAEPTEDMKLDIPDSELVADTFVDSSNNKDVNVEAPTNAEEKYNSVAPEGNDADNGSASVRREPGPPCVASSDIKTEVVISGDMNNGVHKIDMAPPAIDGTMIAKRSFLLDDMSDGNESGTEEDQSDFMKELDQFFRERKMEFKPPKFYGEALNCLKLWRAVTRLGGYDKVTGCKLWRQVGESFRPPKTCTTVSWTFRGFYEKALLEYERHKVMAGELHVPLASEPEPMNIDNQASGSGRARRDSAARAMQGWHSQRANGNGEVSDPAMKDKNLVLHQKREKQIGTTPGMLKRKRPSSAEHGVKSAVQVSKPMLDVTVVDVGPPADWVKVNVQRTQDCFEVYALVPGLVREEVRVQSDPAGRLVISGEPENPMNPWGATPFKKVVSLPTRIDPHHTSAVVTLNGQLFVRVPLEQSD